MKFSCNKEFALILNQTKNIKCKFTIEDDKMDKLMNPVFEKVFDCILRASLKSRAISL